MAKIGLTRLPFFKELSCLDKGNFSKKIFVLSILVYWCSKSIDAKFSKTDYLYALGHNLNLSINELENIINEFIEKGFIELLKKSKAQIKLEKKGEYASISDDDYKSFVEFYKVNFYKLSSSLKAHNCNLSTKLLSHASDDSFDLYDIIELKKLPCKQILKGKILDDDFIKAANFIATFACSIVKDDESFANKAIAQAWLMMLCPPQEPNDIAARFLATEQRAIDLNLTDGNIFIPDASLIGNSYHLTNHYTNKSEPKIICAAMYIGLCNLISNLEFTSECNVPIIQKALELIYKHTSIKAKLTDSFFANIEDKSLQAQMHQMYSRINYEQR